MGALPIGHCQHSARAALRKHTRCCVFSFNISPSAFPLARNIHLHCWRAFCCFYRFHFPPYRTAICPIGMFGVAARNRALQLTTASSASTSTFTRPLAGCRGSFARPVKGVCSLFFSLYTFLFLPSILLEHHSRQPLLYQTADVRNP